MTLADVRRDKAELRSDQAVQSGCKRCGVPVLTALVGRTAALRVYADPEPLNPESERQARCQSRLTWCLRTGHKVLPDRLIWRGRLHASAGRCDHTVVADHVCEDRKGRLKMGKDPFNTDKELKDTSVKRDRYGRYLLPHPNTNREQSWQRVTTFCKITTDQFNLTQWQLRNVAVGIAKRPDLSALASTMDITADKTHLNKICEQAKEAAGSTSAANRGTALHAMTEEYDHTGSLDGVAEAYRPRIDQYADALKQAGVKILPGMIERIIVHTGYETAGTFDRVVELSDGSWCVLDLKTGRDLSYGWQEIAVQLALYAEGFNAHGVWNAGDKVWDKPLKKVRNDFALVVHMPATGEGVTVHGLSLATGRNGAELCAAVRGYRKAKAVVAQYDPATLVPDTSEPITWLDAARVAKDPAELLKLRDTARSAGKWDAELAAACKARAAELKGQA